jgi:hypothetical protein
MDRLANDDYSGQLRSLRLILGKNYRQISTATLAAMVHLDPVIIRGIESGRRLLNDADRAHIEVYLGARWDAKTRQWICAWSGLKPIPYDRLEYHVYCSQQGETRNLVDSNLVVFDEALTTLLHALSAQAAQVALIKLHQQIVDIARGSDLSPELVFEIETRRPYQPEKLSPVRGTEKEKGK